MFCPCSLAHLGLTLVAAASGVTVPMGQSVGSVTSRLGNVSVSLESQAGAVISACQDSGTTLLLVVDVSSRLLLLKQILKTFMQKKSAQVCF